MINLHTRKCTSCGQEKPLTAFLVLQKDQTKTYGNICATCRSAASSTERDRSTQKRLSIDNAAKVLAELEQKLFLEKKEELAKEAQEKRNEEKTKEEHEQELFLSKEKILQKISLDNTSAKEPAKKTSSEIMAKLTKEQKIATDTAFLTHEHQTHEAVLQKASEEETQRITELDFTNTFIAPNTGENRLIHNQAAKQFFAWVGTSAANKLGEIYQKKTKADATPTQKAEPKPSSEKKYNPRMLSENHTAETEEKTLINQMEQIWKSPSSKSKM
jgi:hypothetical protein